MIPVKLESHWPKGLGGDSNKSKLFMFFIYSSCGHFVYRSGTVLAGLVEGYLTNIPMKFE